MNTLHTDRAAQARRRLKPAGAAIVAGVAGIGSVLAHATPAVAAATTTVPGAGPTSTTTTLTTTTVAGAGGRVIELSPAGGAWFVCVVLATMVATWFGLTAYDRYATNRWRRTDYSNMMKTIVERGTPIDDAERYLTAMGKAPDGSPGLTRALLAFGLMTLVGVALVVLVVGDGSRASEPLKTVITSVTAALTTVVGFYFGARTQSDAGKATAPSSTAGSTPPDGRAEATPTTAPAPAAPTVTALDPSSARAGDPVTLRGTGLADVVTVLFGTLATTGLALSDTAYVCKVPTGHGTVDVRAVSAGGLSPASAATRLTYKDVS